MSHPPYNFYKFDQDTPFMSCENVFAKQTDKDIILDIIINNYTIHDNFDFKNQDIFFNNTNKPYGEKIFLHVIDWKFNGSILILRVKTTDCDYLFIDEFSNSLLKLSPSDRVFENKPDQWKLYYLISIYSSFGFVKVQKPQIIIESDKIFSELDFFCEVGFSIQNQWGYIGNNFYSFYLFLDTLSDNCTFIWNNYNLAEKKLIKKDASERTVLENINIGLTNKHKVIYR